MEESPEGIGQPTGRSTQPESVLPSWMSSLCVGPSQALGARMPAKSMSRFHPIEGIFTRSVGDLVSG